MSFEVDFRGIIDENILKSHFAIKQNQKISSISVHRCKIQLFMSTNFLPLSSTTESTTPDIRHELEERKKECMAWAVEEIKGKIPV